jgi:hypothetical protein
MAASAAPPPTSELWVTVIAGALMAVNGLLKKFDFPVQIDDHTITAIAGLIVAYIVGRSVVKAAFAMKA